MGFEKLRVTIEWFKRTNGRNTEDFIWRDRAFGAMTYAYRAGHISKEQYNELIKEYFPLS